MKTTLNIAAGKSNPIDFVQDAFVVNLDISYFDYATPKEIEIHYEMNLINLTGDTYKCNCDAFEFMEKTTISFDQITCYRFLEHADKDRVLYFIYLMSACLKIGGEVAIIVPDYKKLSKMILSEIPGEHNWEAHDILVTTEVVNHSAEPHASVWTQDRLPYFFELEGRFKTTYNEPYEFDGRDIYIRYQAKRIK